MKHKLFLFLFLFVLVDIVFAQTGTIKIANSSPPVAKDSAKPKQFFIAANFGVNYTFKKNNKIGADLGIDFIFVRPNRSPIFIGLQYGIENQYYKLSSFNKATGKTDVSHARSQNQSQYIKIPIGLSGDLMIGGLRGVNIIGGLIYVGLTGEYLLENKNEYNRLNITDFNQFNLSWSLGIKRDVNPKMKTKIAFTRDFFENLKDRNIYDSNGIAIGKQKSKTNLLSFSIYYVFK